MQTLNRVYPCQKVINNFVMFLRGHVVEIWNLFDGKMMEKLWWRWRKVVSKLENDNDDDNKKLEKISVDFTNSHSWSIITPYLGLNPSCFLLFFLNLILAVGLFSRICLWNNNVKNLTEMHQNIGLHIIVVKILFWVVIIIKISYKIVVIFLTITWHSN